MTALYAAVTYGLLFCPIPRQPGQYFRNTMYVLPVLMIAAWLSRTASRGWVRNGCVLFLYAAVLLPYSALLNSGASDQYALGGVVPWSDAFTMQLNTQRFLYGWKMGQAAAIRPISLVFYGLFLWLSGNQYFLLQVLLCVLTAFCLLGLLREVSLSYGPVCAAIAFTILFYYIRQRLGTFMTEPYGFLCGLLSLTLLLTGIRRQKHALLWAGFLMLSLGENARPAALFLFPTLGLWYFFICLKGHSRRVLYAAVALLMMLSGFGINKMTQHFVYGDKTIPNRQAAEMVYGLCLGGKSWGEVTGTPEMIALNDSENLLGDLAELCLPILKEHPENILSALKTIFADSLIQSEYYGAFSYVNGSPKHLQKLARYGLMTLWCSGIICLFRKRKDASASFLLAAVLGILLSECAAVPFSSNYLRLYAVSMGFPAIVTGLLPQTLLRRALPDKASQPEQTALPAVILSGVLLLAALAAPAFLAAHPLDRGTRNESLCDASQDVLVTSVDPGSYFYMVNTEDITEEHAPSFRLPYARQHFHDTATAEMFPFTDAIEENTAIIRGIDLESGKDALIFAPLESVAGQTGKMQFCGHYLNPPVLRQDRFFIAESAAPLP